MVYIFGIILFIQLFNLQIIHGAEYADQSNTRLTRESILEASRGAIVDKTGNNLAITEMGFSLELYKSKIENEELNNTILNMVNLLEKNGDKYVDSFPIRIDPFETKFNNEESFLDWKKAYKIDAGASPEECFYFFKEKYDISNENIYEIRKIIGIRYEITRNGYSSIKSIKISSNISRASALELNEQSNNFPGISVVVEPVRKYTEGSLASHILGYIGSIREEELKANEEIYSNDDYVGRIGIEYICEEYLRGQKGVKQIDMAVDGTVTGEYVTEEAVSGSTVVLTIDSNVQKVTETALKNNMEKIKNGGFSESYDVKSGAVVVMNVHSGEILALASYPDYEPQEFVGGISTAKWNEYNEPGKKTFLNRATQESYAPGSIFKMVSAVAALETEVTNTREYIYDTGIYPKAHKPKCWVYTDYGRGHGSLNIEGAIKNSCNYFFYEMGIRMGIENLEKYAKYFGLGSKTGVELLGETSGILASKELRDKKGEGEGYVLNAVIGQSDNSFSPIQMAKYISILANGCHQIRPTLIKTIINPDGTEVTKEEILKFVDEKLGINNEVPEDINVSEENLSAVLEGMRSVTTESGGTAYSTFRNFTIEVGGKTGSAEAGSNVNAWFAGFAPFDTPEIAVVVMIENGGHGSYTAEVVRDIMAEYFGMNAGTVVENMTAIPYIEQFN